MTSDSLSPVALVTGAARRIGRGIALELAAAGLAVAVHYRSSRDDAVRVVSEITAQGGVAQAFAADLALPGAARELARDVLERFGRVDVLVNNASAFPASPLPSGDGALFDATVEQVLAIHVAAPLALADALANSLRERGQGAIVNLGDACPTRAHHAPYLASKAALESLTRSLARDLAPDIRVNMVAPGSILPAAHDGDDVTPRLIASVPMQRLGEVREVAAAVRFLALDAQFVTGQVLALDGGQYS